RTRPEHMNLIGLFANTVALRCRLDGDATFEAVLRGVKRCVLGAFAHQDVPFDQVAAAVRPGERADAAPLFNTLFVLQNQPREVGSIDGLELRQLPLARVETELPLSVSILPLHGGLEIRAEYQARALSAHAIALLLRRFAHLLEEVPLAWSTPVSELTSLAPLALDLPTAPADGPPPAAKANPPARIEPPGRAAPPPGAAALPLTPVQSRVAAEFESLLGLSAVSADDDFFARGGHSLLAIQLVARLNRTFEVELPLAVVFEAPTVAQIAETLTSLASRQQVPTRGLAPSDRARHPLSFAQQRLWISEQLRPADPYYHVCIAGRVQGKLDTHAFQRALVHIVQRHEPLRTVFAEEDGEPSQQVHPAPMLDVERVSLPGLLPHEADARCRALAEQARARPFDLERGPLLRLVLVDLSGEEHAVILTVHHIAWDGWSGSVLFRELDAAYEAYAAGRAPELPPLPARYLDYVYWQHASAAAPAFREHVGYWLRKLAGPPPSPFAKLAAGPSGGAANSPAACALLARVPPDQVEALHEVSRASGVTLFVTLLTGFGVLMHREAECTDLCAVTVMAGRCHPDFEGLIGCFVNSCVLRTDMGDDPTLRELLGRFGQTVLDAQVHQLVPFDDLLRRLPRRAPDRGLLPDYCRVLFVLQNAPRAEGVPSFGAIRPFLVEHTSTPFDLVFEITEMNGAA
ncbi:MAG TPA: condensation domain-containing protein, partial [Polyangiaceae bacterium]|nr:condensation domain-containing protein [Polyangiaceae bacterium]